MNLSNGVIFHWYRLPFVFLCVQISIIYQLLFNSIYQLYLAAIDSKKVSTKKNICTNLSVKEVVYERRLRKSGNDLTTYTNNKFGKS